MNTPTKGALAMVLAGSVTFSVTNAVLVDQLAKQFTENAFTIYRDLKKADVIRPAEKKVKDQTSTISEKESHTKLSDDIPVSHTAYENGNKEDRAAPAIQQDSKKFSKSTATNPVSTKETATITPDTATVSVPSTKAPMKTTPSNTAETKETSSAAKHETSAKAPTTQPAPIGKNTNSAAAAPPRGQEVSQAAKEKAAIDQDKKENNGKNK
ncbi:hypothetical protein CYOC110262_24350 [Cytobacillus oceanisediminis]|uniref:Uncharacterized protein n=1 Tax=Cytobacillus oceanisediminis TaxID=665099 RepID=A0A562J5R6_9BACI|nr:hypothetical protein [Cytobacillus oceanisediminis]TWH78528.1 hypothetical protein IQ19_05292 [Cytobacillus oceanisediminis]